MIGDNVNESVAERMSSFHPSERQSLLPTDVKGEVKIDDIRMMLKDAKTIRTRRSQAAFVTHQSEIGKSLHSRNQQQQAKVDVHNPLSRATIAAPSDIELSSVSRPASFNTC
jgi:archaeosine-15-forming tRNA-guanine transglycosylase